jgi:Putative transposase
MKLDADEFIRRFLIHVLPSGFQRIRYYGLLGNRYRKDKLAGVANFSECRSQSPRPTTDRTRIIATPTKNSPASPSISAPLAT